MIRVMVHLIITFAVIFSFHQTSYSAYEGAPDKFIGFIVLVALFSVTDSMWRSKSNV